MTWTVDQWSNIGGRAVVFNTEAAYFYLTDQIYREQVDRADHIYCDGIGLVLYSLLRFGQKVKRLNGPDIFHNYLQSVTGRAIVMVGGSGEAHDGLIHRYPNFFERNNVVILNRFVREGEFKDLASDIIALDPHDTLIFFGLRKQEMFQDALHRLGFSGSSIGLGAAIDFQSGAKKRAGKIWQVVGLEWLPRLAREPRRLLPRFLRSAGLFLCGFLPSNRDLRRLLFG